MLEFTPTSFLFAIVNFILLAALLYKFLHKPLLEVLEKRRKGLEDAQREAQEKNAEATEIKGTYERRLAGIEEERDKLLAAARRDAEAAREGLLKDAREEARREAENLKRDWDRQARDALDSLRDDVVTVSLDLAGKVLGQLADADLENRLRESLYTKLNGLVSEGDAHSREDLFSGDAPVRVVSAKPLEELEQRRMTERIRMLAPGSVEVSFETDEALVAGVRVEFVSLAVDASLSDVVAAARERLAAPGPAAAEEEKS